MHQRQGAPFGLADVAILSGGMKELLAYRRMGFGTAEDIWFVEGGAYATVQTEKQEEGWKP